MKTPISLLCLFGAINLSLGIIWNNNRYRFTKEYSSKYKTLWVIGIIEIFVAFACLILAFLDALF
jgi:hypothetical protein